jgi:hypothetical protein
MSVSCFPKTGFQDLESSQILPIEAGGKSLVANALTQLGIAFPGQVEVLELQRV